MSLEARVVEPRVRLGGGRASDIFLDLLRRTVYKHFSSKDNLAKVLGYFFLGAPNPYEWNEDAIKTAYYRRRILSALVDYWFNGKLKVAEVVENNWNDAVAWNEQEKAYELQVQYIDGRHASLHHSFSEKREYELSDLVNGVMKPLQTRLIEAGLDGLLWQAGLGNPTATANFMLTKNEKGEDVWVWVDLESGVPALFPLLFSFNKDAYSFYWSRTLKNKGVLFDDIDAKKLKQYIKANNIDIVTGIGSYRFMQLENDIEQLEQHQQKLWAMKWHHRSINRQLKKEKISPQQAEFFFRHPYLWYETEGLRISLEAAHKFVVRLPSEVLDKIRVIDYREFASNFWKFVSSQEHRAKIAKDYVSSRIDSWERRKQLSDEQAGFLHQQLRNESTSSYLTDFGAHIAINPLLKGIKYAIIPTLYVIGLIDEVTAGVLIVYGGSIGRTAYTFGRLLQSARRGERKPWIALAIGMMPGFGVAAYPAQIFYTTKDSSANIAQFILYDASAQIGASFPVIGGKDTSLEHKLTHVASWIISK
ncbi:hypothetical protein HYX02_02270 [Candidatus Woesearchaeota archaeon]|nr:hypothetical protein [Candidatus Woesearchaeota archaeon]